MLLENKSAIITGASGGLGLACATSFAEQGAKVIIADIQDERGMDEAATLMSKGYKIQYQRCDVTKSADIKNLINTAVEEYGRLDCAIANAGITHVCDALDIEEEDFDRVLGVNLKGIFLTGQLSARQMITQSADLNGAKGTIINMSSANAVLAIPEIGPYVVSKGGVNQWTKVLGIRMATEGVRVNAIGPGSIDTEMFQTVASSPEKMRNILSRTPMGRPGRPEEIGKIAVFLASDLSSYITGQTIYPDGGRMGLNYTVPVKE